MKWTGENGMNEHIDGPNMDGHPMFQDELRRDTQIGNDEQNAMQEKETERERKTPTNKNIIVK